MAHPPRKIYRQVWFPAPAVAAAMRRPCLPNSTFPSLQRVTYTSADELNAASVLLNLSPRQAEETKADQESRAHGQATHPSQPTVPETIAIPSAYARRWEHVYSSTATATHEASSPSQVSDNSGDDGEAGSDASYSQDESTCVDEMSMEASTTAAPLVPLGCDPSTGGWAHGSVSLALPEDPDVLSPLHCFMRRYCVEVFSATPEDVSTPRYGKSHGVKVVEGQVGIRCLYCKDRSPRKRPERAVCFPSSLKNIYHSIETWQRRHSLVCTDIPSWVRKSIVELMECSKSRAGGRRQYWEDSARRLGMIDTLHGVRFARTPGDLGASQQVTLLQADGPSLPVVDEKDHELVTDYLYLLIEQMETCRFTEEDRTGGRSKIKDNEVGFPGMQCKHCQGKAGFGRYFPTTANALALANSDRNIYNHIQKCRRCPQHIKSKLIELSKEQAQSKNRRGLRKMFFQRVWNRMHNQSG